MTWCVQIPRNCRRSEGWPPQNASHSLTEGARPVACLRAATCTSAPSTVWSWSPIRIGWSVVSRVRLGNLGVLLFECKFRRMQVFFGHSFLKLCWNSNKGYRVFKIWAKSIHKSQRKCLSDKTFEGKRYNPKLKIRTLVVRRFLHLLTISVIGSAYEWQVALCTLRFRNVVEEIHLRAQSLNIES